MAHMLDDKKNGFLAENNLEFRILKVRSSAVCSHFGLKIFSKNADRIHYFNAEMEEKKHEKSGD